MTTASAPKYEFDADFQTKVAAMAIRDTFFLQRCDGLVEPVYFVNEAEASLVAIVGEYFRTYKRAPDRTTLAALIKKGVTDKKIRGDVAKEIKATVLRQLFDADISDRDFVIDEVAEFARQRAVEEAIVASVPALEARDFAKVEANMKKALHVGVDESIGSYDYFDNIVARTERRLMTASGIVKYTGITSGHAAIDNELGARGWGRRELSVLMGPPKAGKSMSLGEFGKNAMLDGYNVLYVTLEVSAEIIADRLDANLTATMMRELGDKSTTVRDEILRIKKKGGVFKIHEFSSGTLKPSALRRLIEKEAARGVKYDMAIVDYADIMAPERYTDNTVENSKSIYLALRAISQDYDLALLTATQTNREGAKKTTSAATDVAEDFNRVRIADVMIAINATPVERASGEARLTWVANRNGEEGFSLHIAQDRSRMQFITKILGRI